MRLTRHEVVLWAERRAIEATEAARQHGHNADMFEFAGDHRIEKARHLQRRSAADAAHFAFVVRALREADLDPQQSTGQVQDVPEQPKEPA